MKKQIMNLFNNNRLAILCLLIFQACTLFGQQKITVRGTVYEGDTKKTIPFANVYFQGTTTGVETDLDGNFEITSDNVSENLAASFLGYEEQVKKIDPSKSEQVIDFRLEEAGIFMDEIVVTATDGRYRRKNNPAVDLIKNVRKNASKNRPISKDYFEYNKYEKIQLDLNNITEKFRNRKAFKDFQFIFDYVDTSDINGKSFLPVYIREAASKVFYRKDPNSLKEFREGVKVSGLEDFVSTEGFNQVTDMLYKDIDIYEDNIKIFDKGFISPVAGDLAIQAYRYYIIDTLEYNGHEVIRLDFTPNNKGNIAFDGKLLIKNDSSYAIVKAEFGVPKQINLNFVNNLKFLQEFEYVEKENIWILKEDIITVDFSPVKKAMGFFATREVDYADHIFNVKRDDDKYGGMEKLIDADDIYEKNQEFWDTARIDTMTAKELGIYEMIDTLQKVPAFRRVANILGLVVTGYQTVGPFDIGNIGAFYSFNPVEGFRLRFGGLTNLDFHPKLRLEGYAAYGFKDEKWKGAGGILYSFNKDFRRFPQHYVRFSYQHDTKFVGQQLEFVNEDNFLLSFKRGTNDRMLFLDKAKFEYFVEFKNNLAIDFNYTNTRQRPIGSLNFRYFNDNIGDFDFYNRLNTSEFGVMLKFSPNAEFIQGRTKRTPIFNKHPTFRLWYNVGLNGLGGDFAYQKVAGQFIKRFFLGILGVTRLEAEAGRIWADGVPYLFLHLPVANQTFAYKRGAFNLMNFMEFANDKWALAIVEHSFDGFFFNKVPLVKKLKLREIVSFKAIYGSLDDRNNPAKNPELVQFITTEDGVPITTTLDKEPYMEGSVGIYNIFKFLRVDLVKRFNYLDRPDVPELFGVKGLGIRADVKINF